MGEIAERANAESQRIDAERSERNQRVERIAGVEEALAGVLEDLRA
jgi:hypothetical protein